MPTKKKGGRRAAAKTHAKAKVGAPKRRAKAKAAKKTHAKARAGARKAKRSPARKRAPATVAKGLSPKTATRPTGPLAFDEVLEEPLLDVSMILRVKDAAARSQRDVDEDELKQFPDPSIVVDIVTINPQPTEEVTGESDLPDLFAAEARLQKQRAAEERAGKPKRQDGSLFGSVGSAASDEDDEDREEG